MISSAFTVVPQSPQRHGAQGIATTVPTVFTAAMLICIAVTGLACAEE